MPTTLRYIGAEERFFETAVTGSQQMWRRWQSGPVPDENVESLLKTGLFEVFEQNQVFESGGELFSSDGRSVGRGGALQTVRSDAYWYDTGGTGGPVWVYENERTLYQSSAVNDCNRIIHIDPVNGLDSNSGTRSSPKKTPRANLWSNTIGGSNSVQAYDGLAFKRGADYMHSAGGPLDFLASNLHMFSYGDPSIPRPTIRSDHAEANGSRVVGIMGRDNCSFSDIDIDASTVGGRTGLLISNDGREADNYGITVQNSRITGVTCTVTGSYPSASGTLRAGLRVQNNGYDASRVSAYPTAYDIDIINVDVEDCGYHGFHTGGVTGKIINGVARGIRYRGCKALRNGWQFDGHGFTSFAYRTIRTAQPSYTLASGTVYYFQTNVAAIYGAGVSVPDTEIVIVRTASPTQTIYLRKNTATPTTPGIGEFGFDVATQRVYININRSDIPTGGNAAWTVDVCAYATRYITYDRCLAKGTKWAQKTNVPEGHGFAFDDLTGENQILNCESIDNEGLGVSFNRGRRNWVINSRIVNNALGAMAGPSFGHRIFGNWVEGAGLTSNFAGKGLINFTPPTYLLGDEPIRMGGFRRLRYTGNDPEAFLVVGNADFTGAGLTLDNSVVDPGVGRISGYSDQTGQGGYVLARGLLTPAEAWRLQLSPNFSGF